MVHPSWNLKRIALAMALTAGRAFIRTFAIAGAGAHDGEQLLGDLLDAKNTASPV